MEEMEKQEAKFLEVQEVRTGREIKENLIGMVFTRKENSNWNAEQVIDYADKLFQYITKVG